MSRARRTLRIAGLLVGLAGLALVARWWTGNFGAVEPGRVYRSAQLSPGGLGRTLRGYGIRTVLNLRGSNGDLPWYRAERAETLASGAAQVDVHMASDQWLSRDQFRTLIDVLDTAERPLLIHCEWGAERTGLASAVAVLLRPGGTVEEAEAQFSARYLFLPWKDGLVMLGHLRAYERWLAENDLVHSPSRFRRWAATEYRPGIPSREHWPCDPYPLKVVSRPDGGTVRQFEAKSADRPRCPRVLR